LEIYGNIRQDNTCYFGFSMLKICVSGVQFSEVARTGNETSLIRHTVRDELEEESIQKSLHLKTTDGVYTNLRLLLSDHSIHTTKLQDYSFSSSTLISIFDDRIEFVSIGGLPKGVSQNTFHLCRSSLAS